MRHIGTISNQYRLGELVINEHMRPALDLPDSQIDALAAYDTAKSIGETARDWMLEICEAAAFDIPDTWTLLDIDTRTFCSVGEWIACGSPSVEVWSSEPRPRFFLTAEHIDIPAEGWRSITPRHKNAALAWCDDIHGQDGSLRLAVLFARLEGAK